MVISDSPATTINILQTNNNIDITSKKLKKKKRCKECKKRLSVVEKSIQPTCDHCKKVFCYVHLSTHNCNKNYKKEHQKYLTNTNPEIKFKKIDKI